MTKHRYNRRQFLAGSAAAVGAGVTLFLPRFARGTGNGNIRHIILVYLNGGVRWGTNFAAASEIKLNPYGRLPWTLVPTGQDRHASTTGNPWPVSRIFHLKPVSSRTHTFAQAYARLSSTNAADYNFAQPLQKRWPGTPELPSFAAIAHQLSVIHCDANPGGTGLTDHASGQQNLFTGSTSGTVGMATLFNRELRGRTRLPAIAVNSPGFALGVGAYAQARPLTLSSPLSLPGNDPGRGMSEWARKYEALLDASQSKRRQSFVAQAIENFSLDKRQGDENIRTLVEDSLKLATAPLSTAFGETLDGTPVTNGMLRETFGINSSDIDASDILNDAFASVNMPPFQMGVSPGWTNNPWGLSGGLAVRFLQYGSPVVAFTLGNFDTHSGELVDPTRTHANQTIQFARLLTGLEFALKRIKDPDTGGALWDTTVIVAGSEFGRQGNGIQPNGFNTGNGSDHTREQYFPVLGGPLRRQGQLLLDSGGKPFHMNSLWTSLLDGMGATSEYLRPDKFAPIPGLFSV